MNFKLRLRHQNHKHLARHAIRGRIPASILKPTIHNRLQRYGFVAKRLAPASLYQCPVVDKLGTRHFEALEAPEIWKWCVGAYKQRLIPLFILQASKPPLFSRDAYSVHSEAIRMCFEIQLR